MNQLLRTHADEIVKRAIAAVSPDEAVARALNGQEFSGRVVLIAAGKACADDFPLLLHVDEIINDGAEVNIPWDAFESETY